MKEVRFKLGDKVVFKDSCLCVHRKGMCGYYFYGGENQKGTIGTIKEVGPYIESRDAFEVYIVF